MKIISWNIVHRKESLHQLLSSNSDKVLLQEASEPLERSANSYFLSTSEWIFPININAADKNLLGKLTDPDIISQQVNNLYNATENRMQPFGVYEVLANAWGEYSFEPGVPIPFHFPSG